MSALGSRVFPVLRRIGEALLPRVVRLRPTERWILRVGFAAIVFWSIRWGLPYEGQPVPNGIAHWIDLTFLSDPQVMGFLKAGVIVSLALSAMGICPALTLFLPLAVSIGVGTFVNSQGAINHDKQIVSLVLLGQWVCAVVGAVKGGGIARLQGLWEDLLVHVSRSVAVVCYVVSAAVKLDESDGRWVTEGVPRLAVQFRKTNLSKFHSDLTPVDPFAGEALPLWIGQNPVLAMAVFGGGLFVELFCFVGLAGRRWGLAVGLALIALHLSIGRLMELHFTLNILVVLLYFVGVGIRRDLPPGGR